MEFIEVSYKLTVPDTKTQRSVINMECIRRVGRTTNGWARIYWTTRVDALTLDETYEDFILRLGQEYVIVTLDHDD